jgi:hypothetical protein
MLSPAAINSIEFPSSSENILDMDAMALDDLLDWNPIVSIFDTDWVGCESSSLSLSSSDNGHVENMRNACDHPAVNPFSPLVDMHMQYLSQPVLPHDHSRTGDLQALNRNSFNLSQSQASSIDHTSVMRALSYWSSTQDSTSPSRSYSIPSASSEPGNRTRSECTAYTEEEAEINPINKT